MTLDLIRRLAAAEAEPRQFVAPRVRGGAIRAAVEGLVSTYAPRPATFVGWGMFRLSADRTARLVRPATRPMIKQWLGRLKTVRMHLVRRVDEHTWLGWPADEAAFAHRCGAPRVALIHLVGEGDAFDTVVVRVDGAALWFDRLDRRANPRQPGFLRAALRERTPVVELRYSGLTPAAKQAYAVAFGPTEPEPEPEPVQVVERPPVRPSRRGRIDPDEARLRQALETGGGQLRDFVDRGDFWRVDWTDRTGRRQHSAIAKADLTVVSAGICLDGYDRNFDLQSLVGVVEGAEQYW